MKCAPALLVLAYGVHVGSESTAGSELLRMTVPEGQSVLVGAVPLIQLLTIAQLYGRFEIAER